METNFISIIINGGAVGLAAALIWLLYRLVTNHFEHTNQALDRNSEAFVDVAKSNQKLCDSHDRLCELIKDLKK
ncbi:MAG: hypothetical protein AAB922_05235 [Patescibacteria group bacterium]